MRFSAEPAPHTLSASWLASLTAEHILYGGVLLLAAVLRLTHLGETPLSPREATEALAVWQFWQPATAETLLTPHLPLSPATFTLASLLTQLAGDSEAVLRFIPALAGLVLVALPWLLRPALGRTAALVASFLLAISPSHTSFSRTVGGESLALLAGTLLFVCWWQWRLQADGQTGWLYAGAAVLGLGLGSSPLFYSSLLVWFLIALLEWRLGPHIATAEPSPIPPTQRRTALTIAAATAVGLSTLGLLNLAGLGGMATLLADWLGGFGATGGLEAWLQPVLLLGRYESVALSFGLIAAAWATWGNRPQAAVLAYWYVLTLILMLLQPTQTGHIALLAIPSALLVGLLVQHLLEGEFALAVEETWLRWPLAGTLVALGLITMANFGRHARLQQFNSADTSYFSLALICVLMAVILVAVVLVWDWRATLQAAVLPALLFTAIIGTSQAWRLAHLGAADPRERWVAEATDDELPNMVAMLKQIASHTKGAPTAVTLFSTVDTPAVRWYLRDLPVVYGQAVPPAAVYDMVLTPQGTEPALGESYTGADWGYYRPSTTHSLTPNDALRWWFFRQSPQPLTDTRLILWVRADLVIN